MLSKYFLADYVDSCFSLTRSNGESCVLTNLVVLKPGWRLESYLGSLPNVDKYIGTSIHKWMMDACLGLIAVQMNLNPWGSGGGSIHVGFLLVPWVILTFIQSWEDVK